MVRFLVHRPIAVLMIFAGILILGILASQKLSIALMPDIAIPEITLVVSAENTSAREMENTIIRGLRNKMLQLSNVESIESESENEKGAIHIRFLHGTNIDLSFIEVNEKLDMAMNSLPRQLKRPRVFRSKATDIPVFYLSVGKAGEKITNTTDFLELSEYVEQVLKRRFEQIEEVAFVDITGVQKTEIVITPDYQKMKSLGLTDYDIKGAYENNQIDLGSISVKEGQYQFRLRVLNKLLTVEDIANIFLRKEELLIQLKDIASVELRPAKKEGAFYLQNQASINLAIIQKDGTQIKTLKKNIEAVIDGLKAEQPDLTLEVSRDQTELLNFTLSNLQQSLWLGACMAFLIMFLFMKDGKAPLLAGIGIPITLLISLLFFQLFNISINIISLAGLILGVGMMVDNSIIVIDNIQQYRQKGETVSLSSILGTNEVIRPMISSVLTTSAVFIPLVLLSGIAGALFYEQAMAVTICLITSLLVSFSLLPTLFRLFYLKEEKGISPSLFSRLKSIPWNHYYEKSFYSVFRHKKSYLFVFLCFCLLGIFLLQNMEKEKMPQIPSTECMVRLDWNQHISVEKNYENWQTIQKELQTGIERINVYTGMQDFLSNAEYNLKTSETVIYLKAFSVSDCEKLKKEIQRLLALKYPQAVASFYPPKNIFEKLFVNEENVLVLELRDTRKKRVVPFEKLLSLRQQLQEKIPSLTIKELKQEEVLEIIILHEHLLLYKVQNQQLINKFKTALSQNTIAYLNTENKAKAIVIGAKEQTLNQIIENEFILSTNGKMIPLRNLVQIQKKHDYKQIMGGKEGEFIPLIIDDNPSVIAPYIDEIKTLMDQQDEISTTLSGSFFSGEKLFKEMSYVLFISLLMLYLILAAQFESLTQPFIVLLELPIDIGAALLMLYLWGGSINLMSMIGLVVMSGIIINDSILKIDAINRIYRTEKISLIEAIHAGGERRLKSILMTSATTIFALLPFLWGDDMGSQLQLPFAITMIGGMFFGTFVSLYFIPIAYYYLHKNKKAYR